MELFRQGDVLIEQTDFKEIPLDYELIDPDKERVVLAYGTATGHAHALSAKRTSLYALNGDRLLVVKDSTPLTHEEHASIELQPGVYKIVQQREYTPEAIRNVAD